METQKICILITTIIIFLAHLSFSQSTELNTIRKSYLNADKSKENIQELLVLCKDPVSPIYKAYKLTANLMMIDHINNIFKKYTVFKNNSKNLDQLVKENPENIEIRFLRYCVQRKSPIFLGYNKNLKEDYNYIIKNIKNETSDLKVYITPLLKRD